MRLTGFGIFLDKALWVSCSPPVTAPGVLRKAILAKAFAVASVLLFCSCPFFLSNVTTKIGPFADKPEFWEAGYEYVVQQLKLEFSAADRGRVDGDVRAAVRRYITNVNSHIRNGRYSEDASRVRLQQAA